MKNLRIISYVVIVLMICIVGSFSALAQCASPTGTAGEMGYNITGGDVYEYCNGTNWIPMDTNSSGAQLIGHWKLDATSGTSLTDSSSSGNDGTWLDQVNDTIDGGETGAGQINNAVILDGSNDYISIGSQAIYDNMSSFTVSAWVNVDLPGGVGVAEVVGKDPWSFLVKDTRAIEFNHLTSGTQIVVTSSDNVWDTNTWHHIALTWNGGLDASDDVKLYVDGTEVSYDTQQDGTGTRDDDSGSNMHLGGLGGGFALDGSLDDVRLFNGVLTASEIKELYVNGYKTGHWKLDETSGSTITDSSDLDNDGTWTDSANNDVAEETITGQVDTALDFSNDQISLTSDIFDSIDEGAISAWIWWNGNVTGEMSVFTQANSGGFRYFQPLQVINGNMRLFASDSCAVAFNTTDSPIGSNRWHHVLYQSSSSGHELYIDGQQQTANLSYGSGSAATHAFFNNCDSVGNTSQYYIGSLGSGEYFDGRIDDVRIYKRILTADEIAGVYNSYNLVGHWTLDETSGSTITDSSGYGNDGTWTDNADDDVSGETGVGQYGNALTFDGVDDHITLSDIDYGDGNIISVSAWVNFTTCTGTDGLCYIVSKNNYIGSTPYTLYVAGGGATPYFSVNGMGASTGAIINDGSWHHLLGIFDGTNIYLYVDGVLEDSGTATPISNDEPTTIGAGPSDATYRPFTGQIDDVRIYSNALSAQQILALFNCSGPRAMFYNDDSHVMQWCNASGVLHNAGVAGSGGVGCSVSGSVSAGVEGTMQYDSTNNKMVFCDGVNWVDIPN